MTELFAYPAWDKNLGLAPQGRTVVYRKFNKIYKRVQRYPSVSIPPGADMEKSSMGETLLNGIAQYIADKKVQK